MPKRPINRKEELTVKEQAFCAAYMELKNGRQAAIKAGYAPKTAGQTANRLLNKPHIWAKIQEMQKQLEKESIATAQEVMEYFTGVMRGELTDQFGLEASLAERTKAALELAKRTVDMEARKNGDADAKIDINLNWNRD